MHIQSYEEIGKRRFREITAGLLLIILLLSWGIGHASARGVVQTIDQGEPFNAQLHKQALPANQRVWVNGTYSTSKVDNATVDFILGDGQLAVRSVFSIDKQGSPYRWGVFTTSGNSINYSYGNAYVQYTFWDSYFKEDIILTEPVRTISWQMTFDVRASVELDGDDYLIKFSDKDITPFFIRVPRPYVTDKNGVTRMLRYSYVPGTGTLTLVQDFAGLTFPLVVDPVYSVDSSGIVGYFPLMFVNTSNFPQIVYGDNTNTRLKLAVNNSGSFSTSIIKNIYMALGKSRGSAIDPITDLPFIISAGSTDVQTNFTWWANNHWWACQTSLNYASTVGFQNNLPIGKSTTSGRVFYIYINYSSNGAFNYTRIDDITGNSLTYYENTVPGLSKLAFAGSGISGEMNTSNVLNGLWVSSTVGSGSQLNLTTITDSATPTVNTIIAVPGLVNGTISFLSSEIDPTTDFPAVVYVPYTAASTATTGRALNYSYFTGQKWYHESIYENVTVGGMSRIAFFGLGFNSSGTPYVAISEAANGAGSSAANNYLSITKRISPNSWTTPIQIWGGANGFPPSLAFDQADGLHVAFYNGTTSDLNYYYEPLAASGTAPVAAFSCTPIAGVRNATRTCTDASTNTPTSWAWWSPSSGVGCVLNGSLPANQNPAVFPKNFSYCGLCLTATNAFGSGSTCKANYLYTSQPWVVN